MTEPLWTYTWLVLSALAAGAINSLAGGGTLLTFPALFSVVPPVTANATSTVALVPGSLGGVWGYGREISLARRWVLLLTGPSLLGGLAGSLLVTRLDPRYFDALVPWLILTAALLFLMRPLLARQPRMEDSQVIPSSRRLAGVVVLQFFIAVYGGYFGAGIGILMLSALGFMGLVNIHQMNAVKSYLAVCINGISVLVFVVEDKVDWHLAGIMAGAAVVGGYLGARGARLMNPAFVRWLVIAIGFGLATYFFWQR